MMLKQVNNTLEMEGKTPVIPFMAGSPIMVVGPTNCGKTFWINKLMENNMFTQKVASILLCFGVYQNSYEEMLKNKKIETPIEFHEGLPSVEVIDKLADGKFHLLILDDLMEYVVKSTTVQELFTKYCHHKNITAILVSQNIFQKGPNARTISLNSHIQVLFANKRDESQIAILANQLYRTKIKKQRFLQVYDNEMMKKYSYIVIDCTPNHPSELKVRTNIFPGEITCTFDI